MASSSGSFSSSARRKNPSGELNKNFYDEFLYLLKNVAENKLLEDEEDLPNYCRVIGKLMADGPKENQRMVRRDSYLALRLWRFTSRAMEKILNDVLLVTQNLKNMDKEEAKEVLDDHRDAVKAAIASVSNLVSDLKVEICIDEIGTVAGGVLKMIWYEGKLDPYGDLIYIPLAAMTRRMDVCEKIGTGEVLTLEKLIECAKRYDFKKPQFVELAKSLQNLSRVEKVAMDLVTKCLPGEKYAYLEHLMAANKLANLTDARIAISGLFKNLSMFKETHEHLIDRNKDFLPYGLLPIIGYGDIEDDDLEKLPITIYGWYLAETDLRRDPDFTVKKNTLEFAYQLCRLRDSRLHLRQFNVYVLFREYHKREKDPELLKLTESIVNLLLQTEEEIGTDDLGVLNVNTNEGEAAAEDDDDEFP